VIYPTARAVWLTALGAPLALLVGLIAPAWWVLAGAWLALILGLVLADALIGPGRGAASLVLEAPGVLGAGSRGAMTVRAAFAGTAPADAQLAVETNARLVAEPAWAPLSFSAGEAGARFDLIPVRRGVGEVSTLWLRWRGALGLVWKQVTERPARRLAITPDIGGVKAQAIRLFARDAQSGLKTQLETGEGSEFHALREVVGAIDPRTVDWKSSARHGKLLGKEFRVERNHPVIVALDTGRAMGEPLLGVARLDRAINAALLLAYVCLKVGDLAGAYGFDARPGAFSGLATGTGGFARIQRALADLDYSDDETNYTLGLTQLGVALKRRSLVVVFTDFADSTSAELMIDNLARLLRRHVVLFVIMRDEALEAILEAPPTDAQSVSRAVTAHALTRSRELVIARLIRLGARVVDAAPDRIGPALISAYLDLKRSEVL
jgi:uncharacterized protein (DUF58 family)